MKIEIKKFQSMRTNDGGGFSYDLYIDGVKAAFVCDEGNGGGIYPHWYDQKNGLSELASKFDHHIAALPPEAISPNAPDWEKEMYPTGFRVLDAETFLCSLADDYENAKRLKRLCSKKTLFRLPGDGEDGYRTINRKFDPAVKAHILAKYPNATILNEVIQ